MKTILTQGLDEGSIKDVRGDFKSSTILRKRLCEIFRDKIETARRTSRNEVSYDSPNWPYKQAGLIEREKAYLEIISLLEE